MDMDIDAKHNYRKSRLSELSEAQLRAKMDEFGRMRYKTEDQIATMNDCQLELTSRNKKLFMGSRR